MDERATGEDSPCASEIWPCPLEFLDVRRDLDGNPRLVGEFYAGAGI
jgi:hypothetical protein